MDTNRTPVIAPTHRPANSDGITFVAVTADEAHRTGLAVDGYTVIRSERTGCHLYVNNADLVRLSEGEMNMVYKGGYAWATLPVYGVETVVNISEDDRPVIMGAVGPKRRNGVKFRRDLITVVNQ